MSNRSQQVATNVKTILADIGYTKPPEWPSHFGIPPKLKYLYNQRILSTIFDCALKDVSPRIILKTLQLYDPMVSSENIKSHLQKYRCNSKCSRIAFVHLWEKEMNKNRSKIVMI